MVRILTIGHANHPMDRFLDLLRSHSVQVVADVRSQPYSKRASHFDHESLAKALRAAGIEYVYMGAVLGGRPRGPGFYDANGNVLYEKLAASRAFKQGLARLEIGVRKYMVALLCGEEDPAGCHRRLLIGRVLAGHGIEVYHIRGDGRLQPEDARAAHGGGAGTH